jgi:hypothetical protein
MTQSDHKHPTWGVCTCGHLDFMHRWTAGERVDYQGACTANDLRFYPDDPAPRQCECTAFHSDGFQGGDK